MYRVGYQTGRQYHQEIEARQNGDLTASCRYEGHLIEVSSAGAGRFPAGRVDGTSQVSRLAVPNTETRSAPQLFGPSSTRVATTRPAPSDGDLGVSVPVSSVACDGEYVVFVGAAVKPGSYDADVERYLHYPRTHASRYTNCILQPGIFLAVCLHMTENRYNLSTGRRLESVGGLRVLTRRR